MIIHVVLLVIIIILSIFVLCNTKSYFSSPKIEVEDRKEGEGKGEGKEGALPDTELIITSGKKRILIISCYGYGNMGDNMYSEVFGFYLSDCEIVKLADHDFFVDKNKQFTKKREGSTPYPFDYLIIGGGGLILSSKLKNSTNMMYYINLAKEKGAPIYVVSCGVQGPINNFRQNFDSWKPVFDQAKLITVRSKKDKELIDTLTDPNKVFFFRDLGYVYPHTIDLIKNPTKTVTLIVAGPIHENNKTIKDAINALKKPVVIMNMGAITDDKNNERMLKMDFPGFKVTKYYGSGKAPEFFSGVSKFVNQAEMEKILVKDPELKEVNPSDLTLKKVVSIIYNSELVFTGRYHGMIFARTLNIPHDTLGMDTNKILWEPPVDNVEKMVFDSYNHIKLLRKYMNLPNNYEEDIYNLTISIHNKNKL